MFCPGVTSYHPQYVRRSLAYVKVQLCTNTRVPIVNVQAFRCSAWQHGGPTTSGSSQCDILRQTSRSSTALWVHCYLLTYLLTRAFYQNDRQTPSSKNHEKQHNTHTKKPTYLSLSVLRFLILSLLVGFFMLTLLKNNGLYSVKTKIFQSILSILLVNCGGYRLVRTLVYRFCGWVL